jgi:hypothetical protein
VTPRRIGRHALLLLVGSRLVCAMAGCSSPLTVAEERLEAPRFLEPEAALAAPSPDAAALDAAAAEAEAAFLGDPTDDAPSGD